MDPIRARPGTLGRARARRVAAEFARELRIARMNAGLTQARLARLAGASQQEVSRAELGAIEVGFELRCRLAAAAGHELSLRLYPRTGIRLRDSGQLQLAQVIVAAARSPWAARLEVPVGPGDLRAADILLSHPNESVEVEVERSLVDFQAQLRAAQRKRQALEEGARRPVRLVLAVPDTTASRARIAAHASLVAQVLPVRSRSIWAALRTGQALGGDGIVFVRPDRAQHRHR